MSKLRRAFAAEFKREAVSLVVDQGTHGRCLLSGCRRDGFEALGRHRALVYEEVYEEVYEDIPRD